MVKLFLKLLDNKYFYLFISLGNLYFCIRYLLEFNTTMFIILLYLTAYHGYMFYIFYKKSLLKRGEK